MQTEHNEQGERLNPEIPQEQPKEAYTPRPKWQVFFAWILLAVFILGVILYYYQISKGA